MQPPVIVKSFVSLVWLFFLLQAPWGVAAIELLGGESNISHALSSFSPTLTHSQFRGALTARQLVCPTPNSESCSADSCCEPGRHCCPNGCCRIGYNCPTPSRPGRCCSVRAQICGGSTCCAPGSLCCPDASNGCCPPGGSCCGNTCCRSGSRCENGACIDPAPGPTQVDIVDTFRKLLRCAPCGKGSCSFTQVGNTSDVTFSLAVGRPVMNCGNATSSIKSAVEELITIGEAWSVDGGLGFGLRGLNLLELQGSHTNSRTISWSQSVEIEVKPGEMGVMTATVRYRQATGSLKIDSDQPYAVIANQPVEFMSYGSEVVPCTTLFSGNVSSAFNCTSTDSARMWLNGHALSTSLLFPLFIVLSLVLDM